MSNVENTLVRHILGTGGGPETRERKIVAKPGPAGLIKGSFCETLPSRLGL